MLLNVYTDSVINELRSNIKINLKSYINGEKFVNCFIKNYESQLYSTNYDVEYPVLDCSLSKKDDDIKQWQIDCDNSIKLHKEFVLKYNIPLSILSDERFIVYLTHDIYYDYMTKRWPIRDENDSRLREKFFLPSGNQAFTRNTFLRFFWYAIISYDEGEKDPYHLTKIAFEYADPVNQIMERKYSKSKKIVKAALKAIENVKDSKKLNSKKKTLFGKSINNILGLYCLDILKEEELIELFEKEINLIINNDIIEEYESNEE